MYLVCKSSIIQLQLRRLRIMKGGKLLRLEKASKVEEPLLHLSALSNGYLSLYWAWNLNSPQD